MLKEINNPLHIQSLKTSHKTLPSIREEEPLRESGRDLTFFALITASNYFHQRAMVSVVIVQTYYLKIIKRSGLISF